MVGAGAVAGDCWPRAAAERNVAIGKGDSDHRPTNQGRERVMDGSSTVVTNTTELPRGFHLRTNGAVADCDASNRIDGGEWLNTRVSERSLAFRVHEE